MGLAGKWGDLSTGAPNLKAGANSNPVHPQNPDQYFDPTAFELPAPGYQGNLGRNTLVGPGMATVDLSMNKNVGLPGRNASRMEFRAEIFNLFNRANFALPTPQLFDPATFG